MTKHQNHPTGQTVAMFLDHALEKKQDCRSRSTSAGAYVVDDLLTVSLRYATENVLFVQQMRWSLHSVVLQSIWFESLRQ